MYVTSQKGFFFFQSFYFFKVQIFFFLKREGASGFQTPSEDSLELCLSQTGLAKNKKLHQTTSS